MTTKTNTAAQSDDRQPGNQPGFIAKVRHGFGKRASYERIGVAWKNEDGSLYVKLYGTQVVSGFMLYGLDEQDKAGA